ncbi:MAG: RNA 2',3'-cyclic phosphodiesterase [Gammaproteobacteria bacterium]|jgi:2'-5' RNA ligase|nr:RNA 2',3'-cyclic phosphodiesterase [Gammaproteobacteria bacterium]MDP6615547.1 RNA 2',3'-cyclic phosphodiesterase [Gammaproteobacteria bacterium]MDP6694779.1 RNA 2',3'-cyclic phosphodiesterase [Gammaproteobacteria bacterium]
MPDDESHLRLFCALWPDDDVRKRIAATTTDLVAAAGGRPVPPANYHLTLVFLGPVIITDLEAIQAAARGVPVCPFELALTRTGYFPRSKIAWLGPDETPDELVQLVDVLWTELTGVGIGRDDRPPYRPHLSLARKATGCPAGELSEPLIWPVSGFALVASDTTPEGSVYTLLEQYSAGD